jgi:hypothetical protein
MEIGEGIVRRPSPRSVPETLDRLEAILKAKGVGVFTRIDHAGEAAKVGLTMPPTQVLIFGNPRPGRRAMLAAPTRRSTSAKARARQDRPARLWLGGRPGDLFARRYGLTETEVAPIGVVGQLVDAAVKRAGTRHLRTGSAPGKPDAL